MLKHIVCGALIWGISLVAPAQMPGVPVFTNESIPPFIKANHTQLKLVEHRKSTALEVMYDADTEWPNVNFKAEGSPWDWQQYSGIRIDLYNPGAEAVLISLRVDNQGANGTDHCNTKQTLIPPGESNDMTLHFSTKDRDLFWGMRGIPVRGPMGTGKPLDLSKITAWQLYLNRPHTSQTLLIESVTLFGEGGDLSTKVPFPFIDTYGQYKHTDWSGKVSSDADMQAQHQNEVAARTPRDTQELDMYGGWKAGPQLEATGWFRTTQHKGKQWLVTPEGHLFISLGIDCVGTWSHTFIDGRTDWFEDLPKKDDPRFKGIFGYANQSHSMAETIGGKGNTISFYGANLARKFGDDWKTQWRENSLERLQSWGFNTIGNWSQWDILKESTMPFVASMNISGVRPIESATGYWAKMIDVYDPSFATAVDKIIKSGSAHWRDNKYCIGYFVDNELAWDEVMQGVLTSQADQPVRQIFLKSLQDQYGDLVAINTAWSTSYTDWNEVAPVSSGTSAYAQDIEAFHFTFAETYYRTINEAIQKHSPNQLYLGSRFSGAPDAVVRACATQVDVVSFNLYSTGLNKERWDKIGKLGKPVIIGEFHFGATDRGMFHTGLVPVETQADRGKAYEAYVGKIIDHPAFVGCHWFQYVDEPTTGRTQDGENYNIGFVDTTDRPYPLLVESAKNIHRNAYTRRYGKL